MRLTITDLLPGTDYGLQLRVNANGEVGEWSRIFDISTDADSVAPAAPTSPSWEVSGTSFVASWTAPTTNADGSPLNDFSHFLITLDDGTTTVNFKTIDTEFELALDMNRSVFGPSPAPSIDFQVAAVDKTNNVSTATTPINASNPAPATPTGFTADDAPESMSLNWDANTEDDLVGYKLYMSTSGSGFTPGPSNLVWSGNATSTVVHSGVYGSDHYFKLAAVDVFGSESGFAAADARPINTTGVDSTAPAVPTGLTVTPSLNAQGKADFHVEWTGVSDTDLAGYRVRYRPNGSLEPYINVDVDYTFEEAWVRDLLTDTDYDFQVAAFDFTANYSAFTSVVTEQLTNAAPSKPSEPVVSSTAFGFAITHDLTKDAGGALESDVIRLEVWVGVSSPDTLVASIPVEPGSPVVVSNLIIYPTDVTTLNVYVRAIDFGDLASSYSDPDVWTVGKITGDYIQDASIANAKIQDLEANKITAGTGIINNLEVKSQLLIQTGGSIVSDEYVDSAGANGYQLSPAGLIIKSGTIEAKALNIQLGRNVIPLQYADFEHYSSYYAYSVSSATPNGRPLTVSSANAIPTASTTQAKFGLQSLKIINTAANAITWLATDPLGSTHSRTNIPTFKAEVGKSYIVSFWLYNDNGSTQNYSSRIRENTTDTDVAHSVPAGVWTRFSRVITPAHTDISLAFFSATSTQTWYIDGIQIEEQTSASTSPTVWYPPSATSIDGGVIRTGEIRSNQNVSVNGVDQPYWSINTQGGAQFGNANVRGVLIIGATGGSDLDAGLSFMKSANYVALTSGWIFKSSGDIEANNILARGEFVTGATGTRVEILKNDVTFNARMNLWMGHTDEYSPGRIYTDQSGTAPNENLYVRMESPSSTDYPNETLVFELSGANGTARGKARLSHIWYGGGTPPPGLYFFEVGGDYATKLYCDNGLSLSSITHPFQIGVDSAENLVASKSRIQARNNGAASLLEINPLGGGVSIPNLGHQRASTTTDITGLTSTAWTESDTVMRFTLEAPPSGIITVFFGLMASNSTSGEETQMTIEIRQTNVSGSVLLAASTIRRASSASTSNRPGSMVVPVAGLSGTIFVRAMYQVSAGTGNITDRHMSIVPSP